MRQIKRSKPIDAMGTLEWTAVEFTDDERQQLSEHNGDLIKSGLIVSYLNMRSDAEPPFSDRVCSLRDEYAAFLESGGFPNPGRLIAQNGAAWRYLAESTSVDDLGENEVMSRGETFISHRVSDEPLSKNWFFFKIYRCCGFFLSEDDIERKFDLAARLGDLLAQLEIRHQHLRNVERGLGTVGSASDGGRARSAIYAENRRVVLQEMSRLIGNGLSARSAADLLARRGVGTSRPANQSLWRNHNRK